MKYAISITNDFFQDLQGFPSHVHKKTTRALGLLSENPFHPTLESIELKQAEKGIHRSKLDDDYRLIWKLVSPNNVIVCFVDKHDDAYRRARRISVVLENSVVCIRDITQVDVRIKEGNRGRGMLSLFGKGKGGKLFRDEPDKYLLDLGVRPELLSTLRAMNELDDLMSIEGAVPNQTWNQLFELACNAIERPVVPDTKLDASLKKFNGGEDLARFVDSDEFRRVLEGSMAEWMLFLSPRQRRLVRANFDGPARVKGVAGSGKTVVAIHRAWLMAQKLIRYPEQERVLFLTYGNRLPAVTEELLRQLSNDDPRAELMDKTK